MESITDLKDLKTKLSKCLDNIRVCEEVLKSLDLTDDSDQKIHEKYSKKLQEHKFEQRRIINEIQIYTDGGANIMGGVHVEKGDFIGRDNIEINLGIFYGSAPKNEKQAEGIYRQVVANRCGDLPLQAIDFHEGEVKENQQTLSLSQIYIDLDLKDLIDDREVQKALSGADSNWRQVDLMNNASRVAKKKKGESVISSIRELTALECVILQRKSIILGDPGSGKTTFINYLAFSLATNNNALSSSFPKTESDILPVLILVRDFSFYIDTYVKKQETYPKPSSKILYDFIAHDLKERNLSFASPVIDQALENGNALILLDGLDEISPLISEEWIRECIEIFAQRYSTCRYLITCRILPYQNPKIKLHDKDFSSFELAPFSKSKIVSFTKAWYAEVSNKWPIDNPAKRAGELCRDIERADLASLAPNPLLLTVMALVHTFDGKLPPVRALLYERSIDILLWRWEQEKFQGYGRSRLQVLLEKINCNRDQLREILSMLAFQSQKKDPVLQGKDSVQVIDQMSLLSVLSELHPDKSLDWANSVVDVMKLRTGLLLEKEKGVFSFPHRTYQEYLAGSYLSQNTDFDIQVLELLKKGNYYYWRDVILLAVGHLVHIHKDFGKPRLLVEALCPDGNKTVVKWHNVMLAGEVLIEIGIQNLTTTDHGKRLLNRVTTQILAGLDSSAFVEKEKSDVGNILSHLGDPRFNTNRYCLPETTGSAIDGFVRIESKGFFMGAQKDDNQARTNEYGNIDPVNVLNDYWLGCYPVTVAQMKCFVDENGYQNQEWWTKLGWSWRIGEFNSDPDDIAMKTLLHRRSKEMRTAPFNWEEQINYVNHPVVGVNWFEALAYCNWLNAKLHSCVNNDDHPVNQDGYVVRLPTESEWEMAARGDDGCLFPWGNNAWSQEFANLRASKINQTTSVGIFLKGKTFSGLYDMCGNVWEWMLSMYKLYPYNDFDGRNSTDVAERRVLRGGSWRDDPSSARSCSRLDAYPDMYYDYFGFRTIIARSKFSSEG